MKGKEILKELGVMGEYEGIGHCILGYPDGPVQKEMPRKDGSVFWAE
ncbi:MAG: Nitroreductase [Firmicutes bacterium]|nr:Nitroreductase [Bacillota bacterium]